MNHDLIEERQLADLYLMGRLEPETAAEFEEHYLSCPDCLERLELAEGLQRGLRRVVAEDVAKAGAARRLGLLAWLARATRSRGLGLAAAAALAVLVLPLGVAYRGQKSATTELEQRLERALAPQVNVPIVRLGEARGADTGRTARIRRPDPPGWIILSLEIADTGFETYRARLVHGAADEVWRGDGLLLDRRDALAVSLHSDFLEDGEYLLSIDGVPAGGDPVPVARYGFSMLPSE